MPLPSSFWIDEIATAFVVRYGAHHPSLAAVAPQAWQSVYYWLPRAAQALFGFSEAVYRVPSVICMAAAVWLVARLAARLIHPRAGWFAAFACLALRGIDYEAADARPYALGMAVAAAALWFLVRWLDGRRTRDAALFVVFAAVLWRVHLLFWPMYGVYALYAAARAREVGWKRLAAVFGILAVALLPVLLGALLLFGEARAHAFAAEPGALDLVRSLKWTLVAGLALGAWLLAGRRVVGKPVEWPAVVAIVGWWLCQPVGLFAFSRLTGASVFVPRYLALSLPGAALAATLAASPFIAAARWRPLAGALAVLALWSAADWHQLWPRHHNSDWRAAAARVNATGAPAICVSPFLEAVPPVWRPDYPLPGFLYAQLAVYPLRVPVYLFPFAYAEEAGRYGAAIAASRRRFVVYGWEPQVHAWRDWFAAQPQTAGWRQTRLGPFADVDVVLFEPR